METGSEGVPGVDAMLAKHKALKPALSDPSTDAPRHEHRNIGADKRLWLEAVHDEAATMRLHAFCTDCGAVRSRLPMRGRPMGYFQQALANLKATLEDHPRYPKLAQVHGHMIAKAFESIPDFADPYSMDFETQRMIFVGSVQRCRPDLPFDFLEEILPREPRTRRKAYIDLIASEGGDARIKPTPS